MLHLYDFIVCHGRGVMCGFMFHPKRLYIKKHSIRYIVIRRGIPVSRRIWKEWAHDQLLEIGALSPTLTKLTESSYQQRESLVFVFVVHAPEVHGLTDADETRALETDAAASAATVTPQRNLFRPKTFKTLQYRNFALLWGGMLVSNTGT